MQIITRKRYEEIRIGEDIILTVLRTANGCVKIGVTAPRDVRVTRGESFAAPATAARLGGSTASALLPATDNGQPTAILQSPASTPPL